MFAVIPQNSLKQFRKWVSASLETPCSFTFEFPSLWRPFFCYKIPRDDATNQRAYMGCFVASGTYVEKYIVWSQVWENAFTFVETQCSREGGFWWGWGRGGGRAPFQKQRGQNMRWKTQGDQEKGTAYGIYTNKIFNKKKEAWFHCKEWVTCRHKTNEASEPLSTLVCFCLLVYFACCFTKTVLELTM